MPRVRQLTVAVIGALLATSACTSAIAGHGTPADPPGASGSGQPTTPAPPGVPAYHPPADGSGYSVAPFDQPQPLPGLLSRQGCKWLAAVKPKLRSLGATATANSYSGCQLLYPKGEIAQIHVVGPYTAVTDSTTYLKPTKIAGVEARYYSFVDKKTDTICSVAMNPRSLSGITVDAYNRKEAGGTFEAHCRLARKVAQFVARTFIPLAGGTPWSGTPQQPTAGTLAKAGACDVVNKGAIIYANNVTDEHPRAGKSAAGSTCDYRNADYGSIHVLLTTGRGGLKGLAPKPGTTVAATRAGVMPARTGQTENSCGFAVQFATGQVAALTYTLGAKLTDDRFRATTCYAARAAMSASLMDFMSGQ